MADSLINEVTESMVDTPAASPRVERGLDPYQYSSLRRRPSRVNFDTEREGRQRITAVVAGQRLSELDRGQRPIKAFGLRRAEGIRDAPHAAGSLAFAKGAGVSPCLLISPRDQAARRYRQADQEDRKSLSRMGHMVRSEENADPGRRGTLPCARYLARSRGRPRPRPQTAADQPSPNNTGTHG